MGNYASCVLVNSNSRMAKLIDNEGNLRRIALPLKAAELMLEAPGSVVSPVDVLRRIRRISALRADEELQGGKLYLLCPAVRVNGRVLDSEMALIDTKCQKGYRPKVYPATVMAEGEGEKGGKMVTIGLSGEGQTGAGLRQHRCLGHHRRWRPVLQPIRERDSKCSQLLQFSCRKEE
ncbi:PREDICTED: uncharacterized protein LOC104605103 [Nelumbo nucifera]|uniref:Uncharacterized protein LOC104605103 n=1 Tax=Nelumbo nucifera TaxID=4432 RepID=A0A1U8AY69_NELNU|nr:PREDICTED: uncharacterized protein LOC104605103 [Nelumbo nucifera]